MITHISKKPYYKAKNCYFIDKKLKHLNIFSIFAYKM